MALIDQWNAAFTLGPNTPAALVDNVTHFNRRTCIAALAAAQAIGTELPATANHANRVAFAKLVAQNPLQWMQSFTLMLASQGLDDTATDVQISNMIAAVWNTMAGAL